MEKIHNVIKTMRELNEFSMKKMVAAPKVANQYKTLDSRIFAYRNLIYWANGEHFTNAILNSKVAQFYISNLAKNKDYRKTYSVKEHALSIVKNMPYPMDGSLYLKPDKPLYFIVELLKYLYNKPKDTKFILPSYLDCIDEVNVGNIIFEVRRILDAMVFELYFYKYKHIEFIEHVAKMMPPSNCQINDKFVIDFYDELIERKNPIRNNLILLEIKVPELWTPIIWGVFL